MPVLSALCRYSCTVLAFIFLWIVSSAFADDFPGRTVVVDGDTQRVGGSRIRLRSEQGSIDALELPSAKCPLELFRAKAARERLATIIRSAGDDFSIDRRGRDRYGRTVAVVYAVGENVGERLVRENQALPWPKLSRADRPELCGAR